jgi:hypothetical protein
MAFGWSTVIAIYGAILSTALGTLKFLEFWRDRTRLVVTFTPSAACVLEGHPRIYCTVGVVNAGRRPAKVNCIALQLKDGQTQIAGLKMYSGYMPATLNETEEVRAFFPREEVTLEKVSWAFAKTSDGKLHKSPMYKHAN